MYTYKIDDARGVEFSTAADITLQAQLFNATTKKGGIADARVAVIYGQNGSGKSTLAKAFFDLCAENPSHRCALINSDGDKIDPSKQGASNIHVFNEDFINRNIFFKSEGLATIVLLGSQVNLQDKVDTLNGLLTKEQRKLEKLNYNVLAHKRNLRRAKEKLRSSFKEDQHWRDRQQQINRSSQTVQVTEQVCIDAFSCFLDETTAATTLVEEFHSKLAAYRKLADNSQKISKLRQLENPYDSRTVNEYIGNRPEQIVLGNDDVVHSRLRESHPGIEQMKSLLTIINNAEFCPTCFRDIDDRLKGEINSVVALELKDRKNAEKIDLAELTKEAPVIDLEMVSVALNPEIIASLRDHLQAIEDYHSFVNQKLETRYELGADGCFSLDILESCPYGEANREIDRVNELIDEWNSSIDDMNQIKKELNHLNLRIAGLDASQNFASYFQEVVVEVEKEASHASTTRRVDDLRYQLVEVTAKLENTREAVDLINSYMELVFFSSDRLQLSQADGFYRVVSRGVDVPPSRLSTGERNIIALAYFFASIFSGRIANTFLDEGHLVVLDDPISSFDFDNRYGVTCLLYSVLERFLADTLNRIVILTHDLGVASDMKKLMADSQKIRVETWILSADALNRFDPDSFDVYSTALQKMYASALYHARETSDPQTVCVTGNEIRRAVESFSRFILGEAVSSVTTTSLVVDSIENERLRMAFQTPMIRLVVHPESHGEQQLLVDNFRLERTVSSAEISRIAFELLCFMHYVAPFHVAARVSARKEERLEIRKKLNSWLEKLSKTTLA